MPPAAKWKVSNLKFQKVILSVTWGKKMSLEWDWGIVAVVGEETKEC